MKTNIGAILARGGAITVLALSAFIGSGAAYAAGTAAGTTISNKATLNYSVGTVVQNPIASSPTGSSDGTGANTDFLVDNKINLTVTTSDAGANASVPGQTGVTATFVVSNTGNNTQDFALSATNPAGAPLVFGLTDNFNVTIGSCTMRVNGVIQGYIGSLAPDGSSTVQVMCPIALAQVNNDVAAIALTASAATAGSNGAALVTQTAGANTAGVDVVFADVAGTDDNNRDGRSSARSAYRVVTSALLVTKTSTTVCDPFNGAANAKNIPGAYVQYVISIANTATTSAMLTTMSDALNANVDFDPDLITGIGAGANCVAGVSPTNASGNGFKLTARGADTWLSSAADVDSASHVAGNISINFATALPVAGGYLAGELKNGETVQVVFQVKIK